MQRLAAESIPVLIAPDSGLRTKPRPGWNGGYYAFMRRVLSTELYKQRQHLIETVFGSIEHICGCHRFHRRGRAAVRTEWRLITAPTICSSTSSRPRRPDGRGRRPRHRWGGRFAPNATGWIDTNDDFPFTAPGGLGTYLTPRRAYPLTRWFTNPQNNFASRVAWGVADTYAGANHPPVVDR